jgi:2-octaprenylphenol hydroxylase
MQKFDVLIVGGGMVGLTLALAIRKQTELTVAIVDTSPPAQLSEKSDVRVSALNVASKQIFDNLDVWPICMFGIKRVLANCFFLVTIYSKIQRVNS